MARSQETFNKKEVKNKKEKKRKEKAKKRLDRKDVEKKSSLEDMIAYVDENGVITSTPPDPNKKRSVKSENIEISTPKQDTVLYDPLRKGIVAFFNDSKGFGFIKDSETQESVFVHANNLLEEIKEGNVVSFEVEMGQRGPTAVNVKLYKKPLVTIVPPTSDTSVKSTDPISSDSDGLSDSIEKPESSEEKQL